MENASIHSIRINQFIRENLLSKLLTASVFSTDILHTHLPDVYWTHQIAEAYKGITHP